MILLFVTLITISASIEVNLSNATQSSTYSTSTANRAIDGDVKTDSSTDDEDNAWLRFNFEYSYVQKVVVPKGYSYGNCTFTVYVFDNTSSTVCTGSFDKEKGYYYDETVMCAGAPGSSAMIQQTNCTKGLEMFDIRVYDTTCYPGEKPENNSCTECPENTYSANGTQCTQCSEGKESSAGSISESNCTYTGCDPGQNRTDNFCTECPENTYSVNGTECTQCSIGQESAAGSVSEYNCTYNLTCTPGQGVDIQWGNCSDCDRDYYGYDNMCYQCPDDKRTITTRSTYDNCLESRYMTCDYNTDQCTWVDCPCYDYESCSEYGRCYMKQVSSSSRIFSLDAAVLITGITLMLY